jgi:hypothetical protein
MIRFLVNSLVGSLCWSVPLTQANFPNTSRPLTQEQIWRYDCDDPSVYCLRDHPGGDILSMTRTIKKIADAGKTVKIFGNCDSACTLFTAFMPKERLCVGPEAALRFHEARTKTKDSHGKTKWIIDAKATEDEMVEMPVEIRDWWIARRKRDSLDLVTLAGKELTDRIRVCAAREFDKTENSPQISQ